MLAEGEPTLTIIGCQMFWRQN